MSGGAEGRTCIELLQAFACAALLFGLAAAALAPAAAGRSTETAARLLAARMARLAVRATATGRETALVFPATADEPVRDAWDLDGTGITRAGVDSGGVAGTAAADLARDTPGVRVGRPPWDGIRELPSGSGTIAAGDPAVRFGRTRMVVFDAEGHATPGSVFVTDGRVALCAVVVSGATARTRTWCYDRREGAWHPR
jgi:hypothetical protein